MQKVKHLRSYPRLPAGPKLHILKLHQGYRPKTPTAARQDGHVLMEMPDELCADREIVLEAVSSWCPALKYASWSLREDPDFMLEVVRRDIRDGRALKYVSEAIRCEPRIVEAARNVGISQYVP